jgi:hypothetical protein
MPSERVKVDSFPELARLVGHELSVEVPAAALELLRGDPGFAHLEEAEREAAMIFAALTHPAWRKADLVPQVELPMVDAGTAQPADPTAANSPTGAGARLGEWLWRAAVLAILLWMAVGAAHCQNNSFLAQGLDGSGNVVATFPSVLRLKPGSNCALSVLGTVLTINCYPNPTACEVVFGGTSALAAPIPSDDAMPSVCGNQIGVDMKVTSVACKACEDSTCATYSGSSTVDVLASGGGSILSAPLTCGAGVWAAGAVSGTPLVHPFGADGITCASGPCTLDVQMVTPDGLAKYIVVRIGRSVN